MSRWDSRMLPASARRAGRARAGVVVSCVCAVVFISAFPAVPGSPAAPCIHRCTRCDNFSVPVRHGKGRAALVSASS